jgi:hypothetical protein
LSRVLGQVHPDIVDLMGEVVKHGKQVDVFYGQKVIEYRTNFKSTGYQTYRLTVDSNGRTIRSFHPVSCPPECY